MKTIAAFAALALAPVAVEGHGRLVTPPHRGYIGKLPKYAPFVPPNWNDHSLNAGGVGATKDGQYGICGDPFTQASPRAHETGGTFGRFPQYGANVTGACYAPGAAMNLKVQLTANHKGFFEIGLCKLNGPKDVETEACFQPLVQPSGAAKYNVTPGDFFDLTYVLPPGVTCEGESHCVLRWHYTGWNNWGASTWGQEHFWNCADIFISSKCPAA
ncbi:hypothetical protein DYB37_013008 [Aphanomyces astaci]|uniref:Chitin-binding type-4 domain-containing protein n=1 Tax=Aphanomyces astaci TaxID=112090 RepID=A0A418CT45_APHAT|nr:hypothetical protein DYB35_014016 [Aphanomyces astaci]RHZ33276.1 hypothetical protein DYB37_013008 [Aphanomyces astaci]